MIVWAVKQTPLLDLGVQVVRHHRSQIGFLLQQDALFTFDRNANLRYQLTGSWQSLNSCLSMMTQIDGIHKLMLPHSESDELLSLLERKQVTKAQLMPTFDNVADEIKENAHHILAKYGA